MNSSKNGVLKVEGQKDKTVQAVVLKVMMGSSRRGAVVNESDRNHEVSGSVPTLAQWANDPALP